MLYTTAFVWTVTYKIKYTFPFSWECCFSTVAGQNDYKANLKAVDWKWTQKSDCRLIIKII